MKKLLIIAFALLTFTTAHADIQWGIRGGYSASTLSFSADNWSTNKRSGFYLGPTLKVGIAMGFGLDMSAIYDQRAINSTYKNDGYGAEVTQTRKDLALPINLRYSFGFGDELSVFAFAGPQFEFNINKNIDDSQFQWKWENSTYSINIGAGITLMSHFEIRANYNIPCGNTNTFSFGNAASIATDGVKCKTGAWQIGAALYF